MRGFHRSPLCVVPFWSICMTFAVPPTNRDCYSLSKQKAESLHVNCEAKHIMPLLLSRVQLVDKRLKIKGKEEKDWLMMCGFSDGYRWKLLKDEEVDDDKQLAFPTTPHPTKTIYLLRCICQLLVVLILLDDFFD